MVDNTLWSQEFLFLYDGDYDMETKRITEMFLEKKNWGNLIIVDDVEILVKCFVAWCGDNRSCI